MYKHKNIIINPIKRWFHFEKTIPSELPKNVKISLFKDHKGNDGFCFQSFELYSMESN